MLVFSPFVYQVFCLVQAVEDLAVSALPRRPGFDVNRFCARRLDPVLHDLSYELRAVIRMNERWDTSRDEQVFQSIYYVA